MRVFPALLLTAACGGTVTSTPNPAPTPLPPLAIVGGTLIDGTGALPVTDAVVTTSGDRIVEAGPRATVAIPTGARVVDVGGGAVLPGFINAHVHEAFDAERLRAWAQAGVTTVRDMEILTTGPGVLASMMALRRTSLVGPGHARLLSVGYIITVPGGYGRTYVTSPEEARQRVREHLDLGADLVKLSLIRRMAGTRTAARACGLERDLGVVAEGRIADVLVVDGDPLSDLSALTRVRLVVHDGAVIRGGS